jgi:hypothetical protein
MIRANGCGVPAWRSSVWTPYLNVTVIRTDVTVIRTEERLKSRHRSDSTSQPADRSREPIRSTTSPPKSLLNEAPIPFSASVDGDPSDVHLVLFPYTLGILGRWQMGLENGGMDEPVYLVDVTVASTRFIGYGYERPHLNTLS